MSGSWSNNLTTSITLPTGALPPTPRIVEDGTSDTILMYGVGGALIASIAATAGVDGLGNAYPAGISATGGVTSQSTILLYNGTPALGNLEVAIASTSGVDSFGNSYQPGVQVGIASQSQIVLNPNAANPFNSGTLQAAEQYFTTDVNQMMPGMSGAVVFNQGAANQQMATVLHCPIGNGKGYALVLASDSDDATIPANVSMGTVTTDGTSMTFTPLWTMDNDGNATGDSFRTYNTSTSQVVITYSTAGTHSFTAPSGVTSIKVECWGGGGGGQGGSGAGGGGGEYAAEPTLAVTPTHVYTATVGAGGAGGPGGVGGPGSNGGNSTFPGDAVTVTAHAGHGSNSATTSGGSGSTNTTHHNGGGSTASSTGVGKGGAGGGGSGGTGAAGNNGASNSNSTGGNGAAAVTGGGAGGNGGNGSPTGNTAVAGSPGGFPGGGGGTGGAGASSNAAGGAGSVGQVRITYTPPATQKLICSVSGDSFTDSFGNVIPAGFLGPAVAIQPGSVPQVAETWHAMSLNGGWSTSGGNPVPSYRLLPDGNVQVTGFATHGSYSGTVAIATLPAAYAPTTTQAGSCQSGTGFCEVQVTTGGVVETVGAAAGSTQARFNFIYPLNL